MIFFKQSYRICFIHGLCQYTGGSNLYVQLKIHANIRKYTDWGVWVWWGPDFTPKLP